MVDSSPALRIARGLCIAVLALLFTAPLAQAVVPEDVVGGAGSKWFSGSLIQQTGLNCSTAILGSAYTEVMVSGIASYGGRSGVPRVGDQYWTSLLVSIPGNPCGSGSTDVNTDLLLPAGTTVDTSRPIRCFGQGRTASAFSEISNETWAFNGFSGRYCPTSTAASSLHGGATSLSWRPLASGQLFEIFVPVTSSQPLSGGAGQSFQWLTDASAAYANPGLSSVPDYIFASTVPGGGTPAIFFTRTPSTQPFWKADAASAPADLRNRVELWVNVYTSGLAGNLCYEIRRISDLSVRATCAIDPGYSPVVPAGFDAVQLQAGPEATGPNGGYAPLAFDGPLTGSSEWNTDMRITWTFTYNGGASSVTRSEDFHTLPGPDTDGDGIPDATDACPAVRGTEANGCLPAAQGSGDDDHDGIFGSSDACPNAAGGGAPDGCPVATPAPPAPTATGGGTAVTPITAVVPLRGSLTVRSNAKLLRTQVARSGASVAITCTRDAQATLSLTVTKTVAARLGIATKRPISIASATGRCTAAGGARLQLKVAAKYRRILTRAGVKPFVASLGLQLVGGGASVVAPGVTVRVG